MKPLLALVWLSGWLFLSATLAWGSEGVWDANGRLICGAASSQGNPMIVPDGSGGSLLVWEDYRAGNVDIYAQRLNAAGVAQWTADGVAVCTAADTQCLPQLLADGAGGVFIFWQDHRNGTNYAFYAQYLDAGGTAQWTANGVLVSNSSGNIYANFNPPPVSDGSGGVILAWQDYRSTEYHIYAQRLNAAGAAQWTANGVVVCNAVLSQVSSRMIPDGAGGAILSWADYRGSEYQVYAQRIDASGVSQWAANGVVVSAAASTQYMPEMISDGADGAIIVWEDYRNGDMDLYAQRINASGVSQWTTDGVAVAVAANEQENQAIVPDNANGVIVTWDDFRNGSGYRVYAQRLNGSGAAQWTANGVAICTDAHDQYAPRLSEDGAGGALIAWEDYRADNVNGDVYAQRINAAGALHWSSTGVAVCDATGSQASLKMAPDGAGGAWIVWPDYRSGSGDLYAQRLVRLHPRLDGVTPDTATQGAVVSVALTGANFTDAFGALTSARLVLSGQSDLAATALAVSDAGHATCDFDLAAAVPGGWQVVVADGFGQTSAQSVTLTVSAPLHSPTATPTRTATPTATATPSATPTATSSATATATPSDTETATPTHTATATPSLTATPSVSPTPTVSATPTPSATATATFTPSATATPSWTATPTHTLTATTTATETATPTLTSTPELSATPTVSETATVSATRTETPDLGTATPTATPLAATPSRTVTAAVALPPAGSAYPNPARDRITFAIGPTQGNRVTIVIYNVLGEKVSELTASGRADSEQTVAFNCSALGPGIYMALIKTSAGQRTLKFAVTR